MKWVIRYMEDTNPPLFYSTKKGRWVLFADATVFEDRNMALPLGAFGWEPYSKWNLEGPDDMSFGFDNEEE